MLAEMIIVPELDLDFLSAIIAVVFAQERIVRPLPWLSSMEALLVVEDKSSHWYLSGC